MVKRKRLDLDEDLINLIKMEKLRFFKAQKVKVSNKSALKSLLGVTLTKNERRKKRRRFKIDRR